MSKPIIWIVEIDSPGSSISKMTNVNISSNYIIAFLFHDWQSLKKLLKQKFELIIKVLKDKM